MGYGEKDPFTHRNREKTNGFRCQNLDLKQEGGRLQEESACRAKRKKGTPEPGMHRRHQLLCEQKGVKHIRKREPVRGLQSEGGEKKNVREGCLTTANLLNLNLAWKAGKERTLGNDNIRENFAHHSRLPRT